MLEYLILFSISFNIYFLTILSKNQTKYGIPSIRIIITISTIMITCAAMGKNINLQENYRKIIIICHFFEAFIPIFSVIAFYEFVAMKKLSRKYVILLFMVYLPLIISSVYPPFNKYIFEYNSTWTNFNFLTSYNYTPLFYFYIFLEWVTLFYCFYQFTRAEQKACVLKKSKAYIFLAIGIFELLLHTFAVAGILDISFNFTPIINSAAFYFTYFIFSSFTFNQYNDIIIESFVTDINNMIVVIDKYQRIIYSNNLFTKLFNLNSYNFSGKKINNEKSPLPEDFLDFLLNQDDGAIFSIDNKKYKKETKSILSKNKVPLNIYYCIDITESENYNENFVIISTTDPVTGLKNRSAFNAYLDAPMENNEALCTIILDIDNLKVSNDIYGNEIGDEIISDFAIFLKETFKDKNDEIFRIGGDEFGVITYNNDKSAVEQKILKLYDKASNFNYKHQVPILFSTGFAMEADYAKTKDVIYKFADIAMTKSKQTSKNCFTFFDDNMYEAFINENKQKDDFMRGLNADEIEPFFQGKYNVKTGEIDGCEALVRWIHPQQGTLTPYKFLHLANSLRVISEIDFIVLDKSCKAISKWSKKYNKNIAISVNLSLESLIRPTLVHDIIRIIEKYKVEPSLITLEILENKVINDFNSIKNIISELMDRGFKFAIDDFGSGFSNFDTVDQLEVDIIKIDKSLVDPIGINPSAAKNIDTLCKIIKSYNREILIEGVETKEQFDILKEFDVDYIQGYYFSMPISEQEFEKKYLKKEDN